MSHAIIIGGGIAGCSTAYALAQRGHNVTLLERHATLGAEASGNPYAMLYPRLSGNDVLSQFAFSGYIYSLTLFKILGLTSHEFNPCGMLQLGFNTREMARIQKVALLYPKHETLRHVSQEQASQLAGIALSHEALYFPQAGWIQPSALLRQLTQHKNINILTARQVVHLQYHRPAWHVTDNHNNDMTADIVVIANANDAHHLLPESHLQTQAVRGQVSFLNATPSSQNLSCIICSDGYCSPAINGTHSLGATYSTTHTDLTPNDQDHATNLHALKTMSTTLHLSLQKNITAGRASLRCVSADYFPLVGPLLNAEALKKNPPRPSADTHTLPWLDGLYINVAHGSKGFTSAPLCAELLAGMICHEPMPIDETLIAPLNPNRFLLRALGLKRLAKETALR